jgi:hypothetical protein
VDTRGELVALRQHDLGGDVGRSLALAVGGEAPGRLIYAFETGDAKKDRVVASWAPDEQRPTLFRIPAGAGEPRAALWTDGDSAGLATDRGVVWFDDHEGKLAPLVMTRPDGPGQFYTTAQFFWYLIPHPKEAARSVLVGLKLPFNDIGDYAKNHAANRPIRVVKIDGTGLSK